MFSGGVILDWIIIIIQDHYTRSLYKIIIQDHYTRSLYKIIIQDHYTRYGTTLLGKQPINTDLSQTWIHNLEVYSPVNGLNCADVSLNNIHPSIHPSITTLSVRPWTFQSESSNQVWSRNVRITFYVPLKPVYPYCLLKMNVLLPFHLSLENVCRCRMIMIHQLISITWWIQFRNLESTKITKWITRM